MHVYSCGDQGWHGARTPAASIRVMDEQTFRAGRQNPQEGGPKGIDVDDGMTVLVTTTEHQPLQFLDAAAVLAAAPLLSPVVEAEYELAQLDAAAQIKAHARKAELRAAEAEARAAQAEKRVRELTGLAAHQEKRAEKFKAKAARAKAKAGLVIGGRPRRITAPLSWLFYALKRPN